VSKLLKEAGITVTVEEGDRPGARVVKVRLDGKVIDAGCGEGAAFAARAHKEASVEALVARGIRVGLKRAQAKLGKTITLDGQAAEDIKDEFWWKLEFMVEALDA